MNRYRSNVGKFILLYVALGYIMWAPVDPLPRNQRFVERLIEEGYCIYYREYIYTF